ncbi:MAG: hypothetical protein Q8M76_12325, partial [Spirochaetaceae bacterium]|nr:hypothetical protein [Spirochaetaceae bacterium]
NAVGTVFCATGVGAGTGTVLRMDGNASGANAPGAQYIYSGTGMYSAVDATSTGTAVVAYYKSSDNTLYYMYNTTPTDSATWVDDIVLDASGVGGDFVDMAIENTGGTPTNIIHVAYHDSFSGDLKYIRIDSAGGTIHGPYKVDSYLTVGDKLSLTVTSAGVPYIAYKGMGNTGKVAWLVGTLGDGTNTDDKFNGVWESVVIPNKIVDSDTNRFSVGVTSTTGLGVIGYTNSEPGAKGLEYMIKVVESGT